MYNKRALNEATNMTKLFNSLLELVKEPIGNKVTGKAAGCLAVGLSIASAWAIASGQGLNVIIPSAIGTTVSLAMIKTCVSGYQELKNN